MTCLSKTGPDTRKTGKTSVDLSVNAPEIVVKEVPLIPTAALEIMSPIPLPEVTLSLPSPILTTNPETVTPTISGHGASDVTPLMTPSTTPEPGNDGQALSVITSNPRSLVGKNKKPTQKDLMRSIGGDELQLHIHQLGLEAYKPAMDALKLYKDIYGSQSPNLYMSRNKQVSAICQMNGINDPVATRKQRICALTCYEIIYETIMRSLELGLDKDELKKTLNDALNRAGDFFELGNKKAVAARNKVQRKAA